MKDALGVAAGLHEMIRNTDMVCMANYAQAVNVLGAVKTTKTAAAFETTGLVLKLYRNHFGTVPVAVSGQTHELDVVAAWTADKQALTIGIVNPIDVPQRVRLALQGGALEGSGRWWLISHDDPMVYNDPGTEPKVVIREKDVAGVSDQLTVPAYSVSLCELRVQ